MIDDPHFIDAMVQELKSQGLFDQFRKECLADVDTKPAYQNLRQRVEGTVNKFLVQQEWSDNIRYKNQLRDQLRKNIIDSGFLDTGVERIVDQVVNPKIATIFQPKVEEIVYNYLGIEKPKSSFNGNENLFNRSELLHEDLEAVSPDSDKKSEGSVTPPPPEPAVENMEESMEIDDEVLDESKEQDDFESPAFEPLEVRSPSKPKDENNDSNSSIISGLTSQESMESDDKGNLAPSETPIESTDVPPTDEKDNPTETKDSDFSQDVAPTNDSQLSQVSSNSQLLTATVPSSSEDVQQPEENERLDITEEAQMPTLFNSSTDKISSSTDGENAGEEVVKKMTFNFEKDEYDFVGTGRPSAIICSDENSATDNRERDQEVTQDSTHTTTPAETPTETPTKTKDTDQPNLALQDDETSQSEHSLKICEDTFSDEDTKGSQSVDAQPSARDSPSKIRGLSDASSCSVKSEREGPNEPSSPKEKPNENPDVAEKPTDEQEQEAIVESEQADKVQESPKPEPVDDHYQEHLKLDSKRRSSDRDSEDGNEKRGSGDPSAPPSGDKQGTGDKADSSQGSPDRAPEKGKSPAGNQADARESPRKEANRICRSVTPIESCRLDSSSSGIQSGDDSEKSPETLKSYGKPESIMLPVQPVVIDQMLTSMDDSKLEQLLNGDTPTNDATLESLQRKWQSTEGKVRKPKFASNFSEARRLMKVRRQIQRQQQKCREQTMAMAKKYIKENKTFDGQGIEDQGIELEFVCDGSRKSPGPLISSPVPKSEPPTEDARSAVDPELLYFPEEKEVFQVDEGRLNYLRTKTNGLTFRKTFKVQHYRTKIYSLTVATAPVPKGTKRPAAGETGSAKRHSPTVNGISKKLDVGTDGNSGAKLVLRNQRSIRNRLMEKNTPPSVGTDA